MRSRRSSRYVGRNELQRFCTCDLADGTYVNEGTLVVGRSRIACRLVTALRAGRKEARRLRTIASRGSRDSCVRPPYVARGFRRSGPVYASRRPETDVFPLVTSSVASSCRLHVAGDFRRSRGDAARRRRNPEAAVEGGQRHPRGRPTTRKGWSWCYREHDSVLR